VVADYSGVHYGQRVTFQVEVARYELMPLPCFMCK